MSNTQHKEEKMTATTQMFRIGQEVNVVYGGGGKIISTWIENTKNPLFPIDANETRPVRYYLVKNCWGSACYRNDVS